MAARAAIRQLRMDFDHEPVTQATVDALVTEMTEVWRPVVGFECYYDISNFGNVRRMHPGGFTRPGMILKPYLSPAGYPLVTLCRNNTKTRAPVHRLVAAAFLGPRPERLVINHKDHTPTNNRADNLEYITQSENAFHAYREPERKARRKWGQPIPKRGAEHHCAKLTAEGALEIYNTKGQVAELATKYGVRIETIYDIRRGKSWRHVTGAAKPTPRWKCKKKHDGGAPNLVDRIRAEVFGTSAP